MVNHNRPRGSREFYKRLKAACSYQDRSISALARELGISQATVYQVANGLSSSKRLYPKLQEVVDEYEKAVVSKRAG